MDTAFQDWTDAVAAGAATMSQRNLKWVEAHGGIHRLVEVATGRGIHLISLTDDKGKRLVAASREPFQTLC